MSDSDGGVMADYVVSFFRTHFCNISQVFGVMFVTVLKNNLIPFRIFVGFFS